MPNIFVPNLVILQGDLRKCYCCGWYNTVVLYITIGFLKVSVFNNNIKYALGKGNLNKILGEFSTKPTFLYGHVGISPNG